MTRKRLARTFVVALGIVAAVPAVAAADTSFPAAARELTAYRELLVWTPSDSPGQLWSGFGAAAAPLPIPRARFASVDVGADTRGRVVLVYSACQIHRPRHCDLHVYDFASRRHRRLSALSRPGCSERDARISRGAIVFLRDCRGSSGRRDGLYLKRPSQAERRVRGLPSGSAAVDAPRLSSFDLEGNKLAFVETQESDGPEESDLVGDERGAGA